MSSAGPPPDDDRPPEDEGRVVDPRVLAERRARRLEIAEESLLARATRAEEDSIVLARRLAEVERLLTAAERERDDLAAELARRERDLRATRQREFAEQRRRVELEDELAEARHEARDELDAVRRRLRDSEQRVDELARERDGALAEASGRPAQAAPAADSPPPAGVRALEGRVAELAAALDREREAREAAERAHARDLETASLEVTLLGHELDRRLAEHTAEIARREAREAEIREAVDVLRAVVAADTAAGDAVAEDLGASPGADPAVEPSEADGEPAQPPAAPVEDDEPGADPEPPVAAGPAGGGDTSALIADLERAASRLRTQIAAVPLVDGPAEQVAAAPAPDEAPEPLGARAEEPPGPPAPWLRDVLADLADADPGVAAAAIAELAPAAAAGVRRRLVYDLVADGAGVWRITLEPGHGRCAPRPAGGPPADLTVEGPAAALAPFAGGGAPRRPGDVRITGGRWRRRSLQRLLHEPIDLADLAGAGTTADPGLLLRLLVAAIGRDGPAVREDLAVTYEVSGPRGGTWHVRATGGDVAVGEGAAPAGSGRPPRRATVRCSDVAFPGLLAGLAPPAGETVLAAGDRRAVDLLHGAFDAAQGRA